MSPPLEQSRAYAKLGMLDEATALADECAGEIKNWDAVEAWRVRLAYKCGDFPRVAALGSRLLGHGQQFSYVNEFTALALHHLGKSREAASLILALDKRSFSALQSYLAACFLATLGDSDEAARHLFQSLPDFRGERGKTWLDGDLKRLWRTFAEGDFTLSTAHLLIESEFDILRDWLPKRSIVWELDPANYAHLPPALKSVTRWDGEAQAHVIDYAKAPACSALANRFERWVIDEIAANQRDFDTGRVIAWGRVLDAQPQYALSAWRRGDFCAARHHVMWSLENEPERISDYFKLPELRPLVGEMSRMIDSDREFFSKVRRAYRIYKHEPEAALEILDTFHECWRSHPSLEQIRGLCLEAKGKPVEGLACILRACDHNPRDASHFLNAMPMALRHGWKEVASAVMARAPEAARRYQVWLETTEKLDGAQRSYHPPVRDFRGQPDLGGMIVEESGAVLSRTALGTL